MNEREKKLKTQNKNHAFLLNSLKARMEKSENEKETSKTSINENGNY